MKIHNHTILFSAIVTIFFGIMAKPLYLGIKNYSGYCSRTDAKIADDVKINFAIKNLLTKYPEDNKRLLLFLGEPKEFKNPKVPLAYIPIPYSSEKQFKEVNVDCCHVLHQPRDSDGIPAGFFDRLMGMKSSFIEIKYLVRYFDENGKIQKNKRTVTYAITNCGVVWNGI